ncbi:MAG: GHMP kinase [Methanospirillum sp.]|nr:GHMP kinase [Methanospirillum sp.]
MTSSRKVTAFCPGHISGFFLPVIRESPEASGSTGGGIVISEGVRTVARRAPSSSVRIFRTDRYGVPVRVDESASLLLDLLGHLDVRAEIETFSHLPPGCGYGMSAAALLAATHALNELYSLNMDIHACTKVAHLLEVLHRSGLGDVSACQGGGYVVRTTPGPDGIIIRKHDPRPLYALTVSPLQTSSVLSSSGILKQVESAYPDEMPRSLDELMMVSRKFAEQSGLISGDVRKILSVCDANDIPASMTMLGNGVFALGRNAEPVLKGFGEVYRLSLATSGPRVLRGEGY